tara:strand:- start:30 stop:677 length:648 start_codon:yes stop_codon:yes gene_type:complete
MNKTIGQGAILVLLIFSTACKNAENKQNKSENEMNSQSTTETINKPEGSHIVNPLIATNDTRALITFLKQVFDAKEDRNALAISESDGKIFNSSVTIGDVSMIIFDRKEGWKHTPSLLQVYVNNIAEKLETAEELGATIVTIPTDFYGGKLARFIDPQGNLWWLYELGEYDESAWEYSGEPMEKENTEWSLDSDPKMTYIHNSLVEAMKKLNEFE